MVDQKSQMVSLKHIISWKFTVVKFLLYKPFLFVFGLLGILTLRIYVVFYGNRLALRRLSQEGWYRSFAMIRVFELHGVRAAALYCHQMLIQFPSRGRF
jgi:hypothetical protein